MPEAVIQAFTLGLLANLTSDFRIRSNRETGKGRADLILAPRRSGQAGFVIEFKAIAESDDPDNALNQALAQISEKQYVAELAAENISPIHRLAIVLHGKTIKVRAGGQTPSTLD